MGVDSPPKGGTKVNFWEEYPRDRGEFLKYCMLTGNHGQMCDKM